MVDFLGYHENLNNVLFPLNVQEKHNHIAKTIIRCKGVYIKKTGPKDNLSKFDNYSSFTIFYFGLGWGGNSIRTILLSHIYILV